MSLTNGGIRVWQLVRRVVVGLQRKRLFSVEGQHFGKRSSMVPGKYLAITATTGNGDLKTGNKRWATKTASKERGGVHLPQAFLCSRLPLEGDGIRNDIRDGEFSHFEGRWQNRTLKNKQCLLRAEFKAWNIETITRCNFECNGANCPLTAGLLNLWCTCRAHPRATASSAFSVVLSSFPKNLLILSLTAGILEAPPTISTAYMSSFFSSNGA